MEYDSVSGLTILTCQCEEETRVRKALDKENVPVLSEEEE